MGFWARNKKLIIVAAIAAAAYLLLMPTIIGDFWRPYAYPMVVRPWRGQYRKLQDDSRRLTTKLREYYEAGGPTAEQMAAELQRYNDDFRRASAAIRRVLAFVPRPPFVLDPQDKLPGVTFKRVLTSTRTRVAEELFRRGITYFYDLGFDPKGVTPEEEQVPLMLRQLQAIETLNYIARDAKVTAITDIMAFQPRTEGPESREHLLQITPIKIRLHASFDALGRFIAGLHGRHGTVTRAGTRITVDIGQRDGVERGQLYTVCRADDASYVAMIRIVSVADASATALKQPPRRGEYDPATADPQRKIQLGDSVTSGCFALLDWRVEAVPPTEERDAEGTITAATPPYLDATVYVGLVHFPQQAGTGPGLTTPVRTPTHGPPPSYSY